MIRYALVLYALLAASSVRADLSDPAEAAFLELLNATRVSEGRAPLIMAPALQTLARDWSLHQVRTQRLSHRSPASQASWIEAQFSPRWRQVGENVGVGYSVESLHETFMRSPAHRANVLGDFTHVGIGSARDEAGRIWVTFNFVTLSGKPRSTRRTAAAYQTPENFSANLPHPSGAAYPAIATNGPWAPQTP